MPRPTKEPHVRRDHVLKVRVSDLELEQLRRRTEEAGERAVSAFLRQAALGVSFQPKRSPLSEKLVRQLAGIATNLNQLQRAINSGKHPPVKRVQEAVDAVLAFISRTP